MEMTIKTTLAKKNSEMEKLEQSKKSQLRMISSSAARLRLKYGKSEDPSKLPGDTDARKIRMYETHFPGFCYLRNGEYRKKTTSSVVSSSPDPVQCSEKVKAILFTNCELDIYKTMCLHLLGTHIQSKNHIQRIGSQVSDPEANYDKLLPRYVLDVQVLQQGNSTPSVRTSDYDSGTDDDSKKKRKQLIPIYINNEIRIIINSVIEALEAVESSKLQALIDLASSPEELRNMLTREELQDYIIELAGHPLIMKPTSYDYVMAHIMFDKIPEKGTLETVAQVLEVYVDSELQSSLQKIRKAIFQRHLQLVNSNTLFRNRSDVQSQTSSIDNYKMSTMSFHSTAKILTNPSSGIICKDIQDIVPPKANSTAEKENVNEINTRPRSQNNMNENQDKTKEPPQSLSDTEEANELDETGGMDSRGSRLENNEPNKCDLHSLSNSQRILLGLKIASLKCKPINMHQFEGKKKIDLAAIINPIIRPHVTDIDYKQNSPENHLGNFSLPEKKVRRSPSKASTIETTDLENLTRSLLANLRLHISDSENKKRINQFMSTI